MRSSLALWFGVALAILPSAATAFVVLPQDAGRDPPAPSLAPRWEHNTGSLDQNSVRGLGGGLEYAVSPEFCRRLPPRFSGPDPTCAQLMGSLSAAFTTWSTGQPAVRFVNLTDRIHTHMTPGIGAEIDVFALTPEEFPDVANGSAYTHVQFGATRVWSTNGSYAPGRRVLTADIVVAYSRSTCFYMNLQRRVDGCVHFPSVLLHEVGHALGLHHPDDYPHRNLDQDENPTNEMAFLCEDPAAGLVEGRAFDPGAVMLSHGAAVSPRDSLAPDDRAGRNFLYPLCGGAARSNFFDNRTRPYRPVPASTSARPDLPPFDGERAASVPFVLAMLALALVAVARRVRREAARR